MNSNASSVVNRSDKTGRPMYGIGFARDYSESAFGDRTDDDRVGGQA